MSVLSSPEYVNSGSRMVWTGQFSMSVWSPDDVIAGVTSHLSNKYALTVEKSENNISYIGLDKGSISLWLRTEIDRGDGETDDGLTDILNNVSDEFKMFNAPIINASINSYTPADTSGRGTVNTGTALKTTTQQTAEKPPAGNTGQTWWDSLVGKFEAGGIGFIAGGAVVIGIIAFVVIKSEA